MSTDLYKYKWGTCECIYIATVEYSEIRIWDFHLVSVRSQTKYVNVVCGTRFAYLRVHCWCLVWGEEQKGGGVGRRASLDQYSTHIASGGGGCREQHLNLREKDGALGRTTQTQKEAQAIFLPCFIYIYPPFFVLTHSLLLPLYLCWVDMRWKWSAIAETVCFENMSWFNYLMLRC